MNNNSEKFIASSPVTPPTFAMMLLAWILPNKVLDMILGDLLEEFSERAKDNTKAANRWFWQQAMQTSLIYFNKFFNSASFIRKLNIVLPLVLFLMVFALIAWLSYADNLSEYAPGFWQTLLTGQAHMAFFDGAFWSNLSDYIAQIDEVWFLIDSPSLIIAIFSISLLVYLDRKSPFSPRKMACWGYALVVLPYIWALVHINSNHFIATQIGPIMAIGLLTFLYMILPVSYLVHNKLKQAQQDAASTDVTSEQNDK